MVLEFAWEYAWFAYLFVVLFVLGSVAGSFLNVCIYRLPRGMSLLRPPSSCGHCHRHIRLRDNLPLISYWRLHGRCRYCGQPFSMRYFWVELLTAVAFAAVLLLEVALDVHHFYPPFNDIKLGNGLWYLQSGQVPPHIVPQFLLHAPLICVLIVAVFCDAEQRRVPRSVTAFGLAVGLLGAALLPWPAPHGAGVQVRPPVGQPPPPRTFALTGHAPGEGLMPEDRPWWSARYSPFSGYYPWPVWGPLPAWLPEGSWRLGLGTGLAGAVAGAALMAVTRWLFNAASGARALPSGDVAVAAIAGAFLGWQPVAVAFAAALPPALLLAGVRLVALKKDTALFGPWLAVAVAATWLGWAWVGPAVRPALFHAPKVAVLVGACWAVALLAGLLVRSLRAHAPPAAEAGKAPS
jgi:leader peptidase (prepilin peptidase)/N-methyltransferase